MEFKIGDRVKVIKTCNKHNECQTCREAMKHVLTVSYLLGDEIELEMQNGRTYPFRKENIRKIGEYQKKIEDL